MEEIWKPIEGYCRYSVSNLGRIMSFNNNKAQLANEGHLLSPRSDLNGYLFVNLYDDDHKMKSVKIHRLVANAFIPNPNNLPQINHKDEIKTNNCVSNLEWCDGKYNVNYGTGVMRSANTRKGNTGKEIHQFTLDGIYIKTFKSLTLAAKETGCKEVTISKAALHRNKYAGKWLWSYNKDYDFTKEINSIGRVHYWKHSQIINQYDKNDILIASYKGFDEVERALNHPKYNMYNIIYVCKGRRDSWHKCKWELGHPTYDEYLAQLKNNQ